MTAPPAQDIGEEPQPASPGTPALADDPAAALVEQVLRMDSELALTESQFVEISRLFLGGDAGSRRLGAERLMDILTADQFRKAVKQLLSAGGPALASATTPGASPGVVAQPRDLLELDVATKAADRLIGWIKLVGLVVAVPTAVVLFALSMFGISKFEDVRTAANRADDVLRQATATLSEVQGKVASLGTRTAQVDAQLAELGAHIGANDSKIQSIDSTVQDIAKSLHFGSGSDLTATMRSNIEREFAEIADRFTALGYSYNITNISLDVTDSDYDGPGSWSSSYIKVQSKYAQLDEIWLHWACVIIIDHLNENSSFIDANLGFYFLASFRDEPRYHVIWDETSVDTKFVRHDVGTVENAVKMSQRAFSPDFRPETAADGAAFCGILWDIRRVLGHQAADKLAYDALRTYKKTGENPLPDFFKAVLTNARVSGVQDAVLRVLRARGVGTIPL